MAIFLTVSFTTIMLISPNPCFANALNDYNSGVKADKRDDHDLAIELYTRAINSGDLNYKILGWAYGNRGACWMQKGKEYNDKALSDLNKAIQLNPLDDALYNNRGLVLGDKGNLSQQFADYNKAIKLNPRSGSAYSNRGVFWAKKRDYNRAIADFNKAIELDSCDSKSYFNRGLVWKKKGKYDLAIADFTKAIELKKDYAFAYGHRASALSKKGDYGRAIDDYIKVIGIKPKDSRAYNCLAWLLATCPDSKYQNGTKAVELGKKAVELNPKFYTLDTLASAYARAGRFEDAVQTQEKVITLLKNTGKTKALAKCLEHMKFYKAHKPWRESRNL